MSHKNITLVLIFVHEEEEGLERKKKNERYRISGRLFSCIDGTKCIDIEETVLGNYKRSYTLEITHQRITHKKSTS